MGMRHRWLVIAFGGMMSIASANHAPVDTTKATQTPKTITTNAESSSLPPAILEQLTLAGLPEDALSLWVEPLDGKAVEAQPTESWTRQAPIIRHQADKPRTPASTQKLITTFIALHTLGENHQWVTHVHPKGVIFNGVLYGDLLIKGFGDPAMTHDRLRAMLRQVQHQGIRHIHGDIIIDNLAFDEVKFDINAFDGQGMRAYNAAPNAFLVNFGTVEVDVLPSGQDKIVIDDKGESATVFSPSDEQSAAVQVLPTLANFQAPNQVAASGTHCLSEGQFDISDTRLVILSGTNAACGRKSYWLTFHDADALAMKAVEGEWRALDTDFNGRVYLATKPSKSGIAWLSYPSKPLSEQIYLINQYSNNVMTEQMALSLPLLMSLNGTHDAVSDYPKAFDFIHQWWQTHLTTPPPVMSRASGLCRDCMITPSAMAELLAFAYQQPNFEIFKESLPVAGQTGTMLNLVQRAPEHPAIGRAYVKTGTLNDVKSLAGYVMDSHGRWHVFVAMINAPNAGHDVGATKVLDEALAYVATL